MALRHLEIPQTPGSSIVPDGLDADVPRPGQCRHGHGDGRERQAEPETAAFDIGLLARPQAEECDALFGHRTPTERLALVVRSHTLRERVPVEPSVDALGIDADRRGRDGQKSQIAGMREVEVDAVVGRKKRGFPVGVTVKTQARRVRAGMKCEDLA